MGLPNYPSGLSIIPGTRQGGDTASWYVRDVISDVVTQRAHSSSAYGPLSGGPGPTGKQPLSCPLAPVIISKCAVPEFAQACRRFLMPSESATGHLHNGRLFQTTLGHLTGSLPPSALHASILFPDTYHKQLEVHAMLPTQKGLLADCSWLTS